MIAAAAQHARYASNVPGWLILIALIALGIWGLGKWLRS